MRETAGVMELQLGGLKLDNIDCLEPLALHVEVCHTTLSDYHTATIQWHVSTVPVMSLHDACNFPSDNQHGLQTHAANISSGILR